MSSSPSIHIDAHATTDGAINRSMLAIAFTWLCVDVGLGISGFFSAHERFIGLFALAPVILFIGAFAVSPVLRNWALTFEMRTLVTAQVVRMGGIAFLALYAVGKLNGTWALWAGGIDCVVGLSALFVANYAIPVRTRAQRRTLIAWMLLGILDFAVAIPLARVMRVADPLGMAALAMPPLTVITTFFVPLAIMDYFVLGAELWRQPALTR